MKSILSLFCIALLSAFVVGCSSSGSMSSTSMAALPGASSSPLCCDSRDCDCPCRGDCCTDGGCAQGCCDTCEVCVKAGCCTDCGCREKAVAACCPGGACAEACPDCAAGICKPCLAGECLACAAAGCECCAEKS